jgi:ABC-type bacteriocin/lantibiotic exporter with double-glycine peptidase domain
VFEHLLRLPLAYFQHRPTGVAAMETVKSLQLEPQLNAQYRDRLAAYLAASVRTRQLAISYSTVANTLEQLMNLLRHPLAIPGFAADV